VLAPIGAAFDDAGLVPGDGARTRLAAACLTTTRDCAGAGAGFTAARALSLHSAAAEERRCILRYGAYRTGARTSSLRDLTSTDKLLSFKNRPVPATCETLCACDRCFLVSRGYEWCCGSGFGSPVHRVYFGLLLWSIYRFLRYSLRHYGAGHEKTDHSKSNNWIFHGTPPITYFFQKLILTGIPQITGNVPNAYH
jgi:hypothetical protein